VDAPGELTQFYDRGISALRCISERTSQLGVLCGVDSTSSRAQSDGQRDKLLLGAVVEVLLKVPALLDTGSHDPGT
jgi:hypothetical protein